MSNQSPAASSCEGQVPDLSSAEKAKSQAVAFDAPNAKISDDSDRPHQPLFSVEVDSECKAKKFQPWKFLQAPHHLSFHLAWLSYMASQFATFSAAALGPVIKDDINATQKEMNGAGIAAVSGSLISRLALGWLCDKLGPRTALPMFLMLLAPAVFCISLINNAAGLIACRFFIGLSLGGFVVTQYISSSMFNVQIVGFTNGMAAGWGNLGGGLAQLLMPLIYQGISAVTPGYRAWRWAFFVPGGMMIFFPFIFYLFAKDSAKGNFRELIASGEIPNTKSQSTAIYALRNYRTWLIASLYAFSFGVELTVNNVIVSYISSQFHKDLITAGGVGSIFGLMNLWSRGTGGLLSDMIGKHFGMRGRLWAVCIFQLLEGAFCVGLGFLNEDFSGSVACLCCFAIFAQFAEGATYSIVPFVSKRALGGVSGTVGAGGSAGAIICMAAFFYDPDQFQTYEGFQYMGYLICGISLLLWPLLHFPMWGSMLSGPDEGADEVTYYMSEFTAAEIAAGISTASMRFALESRSQRGSRHGSVRAGTMHAAGGSGSGKAGSGSGHKAASGAMSALVKIATGSAAGVRAAFGSGKGTPAPAAAAVAAPAAAAQAVPAQVAGGASSASS